MEQRGENEVVSSINEHVKGFRRERDFDRNQENRTPEKTGLGVQEWPLMVTVYITSYRFKTQHIHYLALLSAQ